MTTFQSSMRAILFPVPCSLFPVLFSLFLPPISALPHPPTPCGCSFLTHHLLITLSLSIVCNLHLLTNQGNNILRSSDFDRVDINVYRSIGLT